MTRPRRNARPPGNAQILCTGRGTHDPVRIRALQMTDAGDEIRLLWNPREGSPPVTGFRDEAGRRTYDLRCRVCRRRLKIREDRLGRAAMALAEHYGIVRDDTRPVPVDISLIEAAI
ncbi:MAG: hypothetical protein ACYCVZ_04695 [Streptosporangiaceae bacterium]